VVVVVLRRLRLLLLLLLELEESEVSSFFNDDVAAVLCMHRWVLLLDEGAYDRRGNEKVKEDA
jgi:hypothetical protein